jgi:PadR family transcriptional regulator PadR
MSGVPAPLVLQLLARNERYGYELVKAVRVLTGNAIVQGEGVVYPPLYGLERSGALRARRKPVNGRTRVYCSIMLKGLGRLDQLRRDWQRIGGGIDSVLADPENA